jgi:NhaP-type Na+/H+ or K+/H+ antiporter
VYPVLIAVVGFVVGAVLWVNEQRWFVEKQDVGELFLWSGTSAVIGLLIGYGISRLIKWFQQHPGGTL